MEQRLPPELYLAIRLEQHASRSQETCEQLILFFTTTRRISIQFEPAKSRKACRFGARFIRKPASAGAWEQSEAEREPGPWRVGVTWRRLLEWDTVHGDVMLLEGGIGYGA
jgi:hypothetical protein